jgi:hypothetical protein
MAILPSIADISQAIQLSSAPVFLLVGIAGFINAFVARLSPVVDPHPCGPEGNGAAIGYGPGSTLQRGCLAPWRRMVLFLMRH